VIDATGPYRFDALRPGRGSSRSPLIPTGGLAVATALWLAIVLFSVFDLTTVLQFMQDAYAYWVVPAADPYRDAIVGAPGAYLYSPAFLELITPLRLLPWPMFVAVWAAILLGAAAYLGGPRLLALAVVLSAPEIGGGNITLLLGVAVVLGFRWPWTWSFVLLSKVTPGVGLLWFAVRRQWNELLVVLVATGFIVAISYAIAPGAWSDWIAVLQRNAGATGTSAAIQIPFAVRLPLAVAVIVWGARGDHRWALPIGCLLAMPVVWFGSLTFLLASVALLPGSVVDRVRDTFRRGAADAAGAR
jgi:glycosyl transferase family 87